MKESRNSSVVCCVFLSVGGVVVVVLICFYMVVFNQQIIVRITIIGNEGATLAITGEFDFIGIDLLEGR